jgi:hypothetical protein
MSQFLSEKIEVVFDKKRGVPLSFVWNKKEYIIIEQIAVWQDWGFPKGSPKAKTWRLRHHRNYYRVQTEEDEVFEIYLDRKTKNEEGEWYLYQKLS